MENIGEVNIYLETNIKYERYKCRIALDQSDNIDSLPLKATIFNIEGAKLYSTFPKTKLMFKVCTASIE